MKKLIITMALTLIAALALGQQNVIYKLVCSSKRVISDSTLITVQINDTTQQYAPKQTIVQAFAFEVVVASHDGTTSTLTFQYSLNGSTWYDYPNMNIYTISAATGSVVFAATEKPEGNFLRVYLDLQSGKVGNFTVRYNLKKQ